MCTRCLIIAYVQCTVILYFITMFPFFVSAVASSKISQKALLHLYYIFKQFFNSSKNVWWVFCLPWLFQIKLQEEINHLWFFQFLGNARGCLPNNCFRRYQSEILCKIFVLSNINMNQHQDFYKYFMWVISMKLTWIRKKPLMKIPLPSVLQ